MSNALVECYNIGKSYKVGDEIVPALQNINLTIEHGEYIAITGASGSGKSSLMSILGCLDLPNSGKYFLDKQEVSKLSVNELADIRNHKIGFVFQSFHLLSGLTIVDNVALPLMFRGVKIRERRSLATQMLIKVGLGHRLAHYPNQLSGGQRQRVAIARALVTEPEMILADEPTGNLDSQAGQDIIKLFEGFLEQGKTLIIVTHDQKLAARTKRIIHLKDGKILGGAVSHQTK